jgi:RND family efflux transporter MFP subunit
MIQSRLNTADQAAAVVSGHDASRQAHNNSRSMTLDSTKNRKATVMIRKNLFLWRTGGLLVLTGVLYGCSSNPPVSETPPPPVSVSQPLYQDVVDHDDYEGRIVAVKSVEVRARVSGHLTKVNFKDGQMVTEKDLLFEIDPRPYKAELDAAAAQQKLAEANLDLAKKEYARTAKLAQTGAASREEMDVWIAKQATATAERQKAVAAVERADLDLNFTKIYAPIAGKTSRVQVNEGNLVNSGGGSETSLTTIVSVDPMYVDFDVPERALLRYRREIRKDRGTDEADLSIRDQKIPIEVELEGEQGYPHQGLIDSADNRVNPSTGTIKVRGVLPNTKRLLDAGMRARVRIPIGDPHKALLVTERAIGTDQGRKYVYVVNDQNVAERRDVKLDRLSEGGLQVVDKGLKQKEWVVVNGIQRVRDGAKVEPRQVPMPGAPAEPAKEKSKS